MGMLRTVLVSLVLLPALSAGEAPVADAKRILDRYLQAQPPADPSEAGPANPDVARQVNEARLARLAGLAELAAMPHEAVAAAEGVLSGRASPEQRYEIVGALADHVRTRECAALLYRLLQDVREPEDKEAALYEELVRCSAVHGLRRMSSRTDRSGGQRVQHGADFEAAVPGLVPWLVSAANDKAERVRVTALYALADSRDTEAVAELRNRLQDTSEKVRLFAACFLTEYQDASGLPEMRKALTRLRGGGDAAGDPHDRYLQEEMLLASFERITGVSFGEIPLNPSLSSFSRGEEAARYKELLETWEAWWNSRPAPKPGKEP